MPQVTVYIREDDLDKWKSIEKKSEFISEALNAEPVKTVDESTYYQLEGEARKRPVMLDKLTTEPIRVNIRPVTPKICEHFQPKGKCLQKKCKHNS